jgi:transcriptional regulator with XRE-family HTH domain
MTRRAVAHYNIQQEAIPPQEINDENIKAEFARRLQAAMIEKGWNQSELARRANEHLPKPARGQARGKQIGRDSVSHYMRGRMIPLPAYLNAIAKALGVEPAALLPARTPQAASTAPYEMKGLPDGRVYLRISRTLRQATAMKIMALLAEEDRA